MIGALIGYFTNYIAVKMLFKPHHPIRIGSWRLPFTPGLIPKRKDELAGAIGGAIGDVLLTKSDLAKAVPSETVKSAIAEELWDKFRDSRESLVSVGQAVTEYIPEDKYEQMRERLEELITEKAMDALRQMDISQMVVTEGTQAIKDKVQGSMLAMMLNDQILQSMAAPIGEELERYIEEKGADKIRPIVAGELTKLETGTVGHLMSQIPLEKERMKKIVDVLYDTCVEDSVENMMANIDVAAIAEDKIKEMDVAALEKLILSVMKKELNAIVNLGALIGLVIGLLNLLISLI